MKVSLLNLSLKKSPNGIVEAVIQSHKFITASTFFILGLIFSYDNRQ